jgi:hypothetical protein
MCGTFGGLFESVEILHEQLCRRRASQQRGASLDTTCCNWHLTAAWSGDSSVGKGANCRVSMDLIFYIVTNWNQIVVLSLAVNYSLSTGLIKNACICVSHYLSIPLLAHVCSYPCINLPTTHYVTQHGFYSDTTRPV